MNEQASPPENSNQPDQPATPDLAQTLTARTEWVQRALSPWTRRWLPAVTGSNLPDQSRPVALTTAQTTSFLGHIQRAVEVASLWRVNTSALQPVRLDRFGAAVVNRFPDTSHRFELQPTPAQTNPADLILAGVSEAGASQATPKYPAGFKPFSSFADFEAALAAKEREAAASTPPSSPPPVQTTTAPSTPSKPLPPPRSTPPPQVQRLRQLGQSPRQLPPGTRPRSKIEEVTPAAEPEPKSEPAEELFPPAEASAGSSDQPGMDWEIGQPGETIPVQRPSEPAASPPLQRQPESEVPPGESSPQIRRRPDVPPETPTPAGQPPSPQPVKPRPVDHPSPPPKRVEELKLRPVSPPASESTRPPLQRSAEPEIPLAKEIAPLLPVDKGERSSQAPPPLPEPGTQQVQQDRIESEPIRPDLSPTGEAPFAPPLKPPQRPEPSPPSSPEPGQGVKPPIQRSVEPKPAKPPTGLEPSKPAAPPADLSTEPPAPPSAEPELSLPELPPLEPEQSEQAADLPAPPLPPSPPPSGEMPLPAVQRFEEPELTLRAKPPVEPPSGPPPDEIIPPEQLSSPPPASGRRGPAPPPDAKSGLSPEASPSIQRQPAPPSSPPAPESPGLESGGTDLPLVERVQPGMPGMPADRLEPRPSEPGQIPASPVQRSTGPEPEQPPVGPGEAESGLKPADAPDQTPPAGLTQAAEPELILREFPAVKPEQPEPEVEPAPPISTSLPEQKALPPAPSPEPTTGIIPPPTGPEPSSLPTSREQPPQPSQTLPPSPDLPQISEGETAGVSTGQDQLPEFHPKFGATPPPPVQRSETPELTLLERQQPQPPASPGDTPEQLAPPLPPLQTAEEQPPAPPVQRSSAVEKPLREFPPVEPEPPGQVVGPESPLVVPGQPPVPRSEVVEMPLREFPLVEPEPPGQAVGPEPPPVVPGQPPVPRSEVVEMPLREFPPVEPELPGQAVGPEPPSVVPSPSPVQRSKAVEIPLREFPLVESEPPGQAVGPEAPSVLPGQPPVQRFEAVERPLREFPLVEPEPPRQAVGPEPPPVEPEPPRQAVRPETPPVVLGQPPVQRSEVVEMPLREFPPVEGIQPPSAEDRRDLPRPLAPPPVLKPGAGEEEKGLPAGDQPDLPVSRTESPGQSLAAPEAVRPTGPTVQRAPEFEEELPLSPRPVAGWQPDRTSLPDESGGLDREVLARATSSARMPLVEVGREANRVSQGKVVQTRPMAVLPQAHVQAGPVEADEAWFEGPALPFTFRPQPAGQAVEKTPLPLVPPVRIEIRPERTTPPDVAPPQPVASPPASQVQRQPAEKTVSVSRAPESLAAAPSPAVIQRDGGEEKGTTSDTSEAKPAPPPDLDEMARQIYPLIKRMLAVERERRPIR